MRGFRVSALSLFCLAMSSLYAAKPAPPPPGPEPDWTIVYEVSQLDRMDLALTIADGSQTKTLLSAKGVSNTTPSFTPDGRHVVFTSNLGAVDGIYAIRIKDAAGQPSIGSPTLLTRVTPWSRNCHPVVSSEGVLAWADRPDSNIPDLFLMGVIVDANGDLRPDPSRPRVNVSNTPTEYEVFPAWSIADPAGARRLAFTRNPGAPVVMVCDGLVCGTPSVIASALPPGGSTTFAPAWSKITPGLLAFAYDLPDGSPDIYFADLDSGVAGKLTETDSWEASPSWAPGSNDRLLVYADRPRANLVILEDVLARMVSGPGGRETVIASPAKRTTVLDFPDWRR